ncbi:hypothetical protein E2C01_094163 [Portunus trituberculatus]|uniref:Uncharacterized protein n=1 Tax=Portunus trituberculatus TaxID=210409 RepID=A0A5B7JL54_PORTR|nr:hypothetical protein [Portunus trituberculatus]
MHRSSLPIAIHHFPSPSITPSAPAITFHQLPVLPITRYAPPSHPHREQSNISTILNTIKRKPAFRYDSRGFKQEGSVTRLNAAIAGTLFTANSASESTFWDELV